MSGASRGSAIWFSDGHPGSRGRSADFRRELLRTVGCHPPDPGSGIVDIWQMRKRPYRPRAHGSLVCTVPGRAGHRTDMVLAPGNREELLRDHEGMHFGNIRKEERAMDVRAMADARSFYTAASSAAS
ncbi:MAG: hypothetical protein NFCOHLIN_00912 [Gammaproteobacteria bacterium]|nr:hypothetical protein [Gammaproteobacteria bacterium]